MLIYKAQIYMLTKKLPKKKGLHILEDGASGLQVVILN